MRKSVRSKELIKKSINYSLPTAGLLFSLVTLEGHAGGEAPVIAPVVASSSGKIYGGIFGGAGAYTKAGMRQYGSAFIPDSRAAPLAVNAFGRSNRRTVGVVGGHIGYQWPETSSNAFNSQ